MVILHATDESWVQRYCEGSIDGAKSRGLNLMCPAACGFLRNGRLLTGDPDFGLTMSTGPDNRYFARPLSEGVADVYDIEVVQDGQTDRIIIASARPNSTANGRAYTKAAEDSAWTDISDDLETIYAGLSGGPYYRYAVDAVCATGPDTVYAAVGFRQGTDAHNEDGRYGHIYRIVNLGGGTWQWEPLVITQAGNARWFTAVEAPHNSRKLLAAARYVDGQAGGVFSVDRLGGQQAPEVIIDGGDAASPYSTYVNYATVLRCDEAGEHVYVGSRGPNLPSEQNGIGSLVRLHREQDTWDGDIAVSVLANESGDSFGFVDSEYMSINPWQPEYRWLTHINDIAIDPNNPRVVYAGMGNATYNSRTYGVWRFDGGWTQLTGTGQVGPEYGEFQVPTAVNTVGISPVYPNKLYFGTGGHEFFELGITPSPTPNITSPGGFTKLPDGTEAFSIEVASTSGRGIEAVTADLSVLNPALGRRDLSDDGLDGDLIAGDGVWSRALEITNRRWVQVPVVARDSLWNTATKMVSVLEDEAPIVGAAAKYPIYSNPKYVSTLAVYAYQWGDDPVDLVVDCTELNGDPTVAPVRVSGADPDTAMATIEGVAASDGTYLLPFRADGSGGQVLYGYIEAEVTSGAAQTFNDLSSENLVGALATEVHSTPLAIMPANADSGAVMDMIVTEVGDKGKYYNARDLGGFAPNFQDATTDRFGTIYGNRLTEGTSNCAAADYDGDGREDFIACSNGELRLYHLDLDSPGNPVYRVTTTAFTTNIPDTTFAAVWFDYNRDGWIDLALAGTAGGHDGVFIYWNDLGHLAFTQRTTVNFGAAVRDSTGPCPLIWTDLIAGDGGQVELITQIMVGGVPTLQVLSRQAAYDPGLECYVFEDATPAVFGSNAPTYVSKVAVADLDGDGDQDLVCARNSGDATAQLVVYKNNAGQLELVASAIQPIGGAIEEGLSSVVVADMDPDGKPDLVAIPASDFAAPRFLVNTSETGILFEEVATTLPLGSAAGGLAYDWLGGKPNLYLAKGPTGDRVEQFYYGYKPADGVSLGKTVRVRVGETDCANTSGIGTRVEVEWDGKHAYQWFNGGEGRGSQQPRELVFMLGKVADDNIYVRALWPDGVTTEQMQFKTNDGRFLINRNEHATIDEATVLATFVFDPAGHNQYRFEWDADRLAVPAVDFVFLDARAECRCGEPDTSLTLAMGDDGVETDIALLEDGHTWHYTMIWGNRCCEATVCSFRFRAICHLADIPSYSEWHRFTSPKYCPSN